VENNNNIDPGLYGKLNELKDSLMAAQTEAARTEINKQLDLRLDEYNRQLSGRQIPGADREQGFKGLVGETLKSNEGKIREFMAKRMAGDLIIETKAAGDMGLGNITGGTTSISSVLPGITANAPRKTHIGELLQRVSITGDMVALRENGTGEGAIAAVGEMQPKPQRDYDLVETTFPANFIAGYARVSRRFMLTVPGATNFLTSRLLEDYLTAEDHYLLNGTGVPPEIKGINVAGNFTAATSLDTDNDYVQLVLGVGQLAALGRSPDLIILHPDNLYALMVNTAAGSGEFDSPAVVQITPEGGMRVAGVNVVTSTAQTVGTYIIIDRAGFIIGVLDALNIRFFEQDQDNVIKNMVTVRVESNLAFAVLANNYAVKGSFTAVIPFAGKQKK
jgi:hypothetical protein